MGSIQDRKRFVLGGMTSINSDEERRNYTNKLVLVLLQRSNIETKTDYNELSMVALFSQFGALFDLPCILESLRKSFELIRRPQGTFLELFLQPNIGFSTLFESKDYAGDGIFRLCSVLEEAPPILDRYGKIPSHERHEIDNRWGIPLVYIICRMAYDVLFQQPSQPSIQELVQKIEELTNVLPKVTYCKQAGIGLFLFDLMLSKDRKPEGFTLDFLMKKLEAKRFESLQVAAKAACLSRDEMRAHCVERFLESQDLVDPRDYACFMLFHSFCSSIYLKSLKERLPPTNADNESLRARIFDPSYVPITYIKYLLSRDNIYGAIIIAADIEKNNYLPLDDQVRAYHLLIEHHIHMGTIFYNTQMTWHKRYVNAYIPLSGRLGLELLLQTLHTMPEKFSPEHYSLAERQYLSIACHQTILSLLVHKFGDQAGLSKFSSYWSAMPVLSLQKQKEWARNFLEQENPIPDTVELLEGDDGVARPDLDSLISRSLVEQQDDDLIPLGGDEVDDPVVFNNQDVLMDDDREVNDGQVDVVDHALVDGGAAGKDLRVGDDGLAVAAEDGDMVIDSNIADEGEYNGGISDDAMDVDEETESDRYSVQDEENVEDEESDQDEESVREEESVQDDESDQEEENVLDEESVQDEESAEIVESVEDKEARYWDEEDEVADEEENLADDDEASDPLEAGYDAGDSQQDRDSQQEHDSQQDYSVVDENEAPPDFSPVLNSGMAGAVRDPVVNENADLPNSFDDTGYLAEDSQGEAEFVRPQKKTRLESGYLGAEESQGQSEEEGDEEPVDEEIHANDEDLKVQHDVAISAPVAQPLQNITLSDMSAADERSELEENMDVRHERHFSTYHDMQQTECEDAVATVHLEKLHDAMQESVASGEGRAAKPSDTTYNDSQTEEARDASGSEPSVAEATHNDYEGCAEDDVEMRSEVDGLAGSGADAEITHDRSLESGVEKTGEAEKPSDVAGVANIDLQDFTDDAIAIDKATKIDGTRESGDDLETTHDLNSDFDSGRAEAGKPAEMAVEGDATVNTLQDHSDQTSVHDFTKGNAVDVEVAREGSAHVKATHESNIDFACEMEKASEFDYVVEGGATVDGIQDHSDQPSVHDVTEGNAVDVEVAGEGSAHVEALAPEEQAGSHNRTSMGEELPGEALRALKTSAGSPGTTGIAVDVEGGGEGSAHVEALPPEEQAGSHKRTSMGEEFLGEPLRAPKESSGSPGTTGIAVDVEGAGEGSAHVDALPPAEQAGSHNRTSVGEEFPRQPLRSPGTRSGMEIGVTSPGAGSTTSTVTATTHRSEAVNSPPRLHLGSTGRIPLSSGTKKIRLQTLRFDDESTGGDEPKASEIIEERHDKVRSTKRQTSKVPPRTSSKRKVAMPIQGSTSSSVASTAVAATPPRRSARQQNRKSEAENVSTPGTRSSSPRKQINKKDESEGASAVPAKRTRSTRQQKGKSEEEDVPTPRTQNKQQNESEDTTAGPPKRLRRGKAEVYHEDESSVSRYSLRNRQQKNEEAKKKVDNTRVGASARKRKVSDKQEEEETSVSSKRSSVAKQADGSTTVSSRTRSGAKAKPTGTPVRSATRSGAKQTPVSTRSTRSNTGRLTRSRGSLPDHQE